MENGVDSVDAQESPESIEVANIAAGNLDVGTVRDVLPVAR
jgi:hypothetical protein